MTTLFPTVHAPLGSAWFSEDGLYRYHLSRQWGDGPSKVAWILLNPSTATAEKPDPTITRAMSFSQRWGFDGLHILNLYGYRSPYPEDLLKVDDPEGPYNAKHVAFTLEVSQRVIVGWGTNTGKLPRSSVLDVLKRYQECGGKLHCLGVNADGSPGHPLYLKHDTQLQRFDASQL